MKKSILNIGKTLNKVEQKEINGGGRGCLSGACFPMPFFCQEGTNVCAVPVGLNTCFGTHNGTLCCLN
jgi:hypothetical protein